MMLSALLVIALFGLCCADDGHNNEAGAARPTDTAGKEDITKIIQRMNNGSNEFLEGDLLLPTTRSAMKCLDSPDSCLWPKSDTGYVEIFYELSDKYNSAEKKEIVRALKDFETKTCLRFFPRQQQRAYLSFQPRFGCASFPGYMGMKQVVSLARFGCVTFGVVQHEVMHALGFYHEQNRSDRDQYVRVYWDRIIPGFKINFRKKETNNLGVPYDYSSIMHYPRNYFGLRPSEVTMIPIPDPDVPIGRRNSMSQLDVLKINLLYQCDDLH